MSFISSFSRDLCASQGEEDGEDEVEVGNSYLLHLLRPNSYRAHRKNFLLGWSDRHGTRGNTVGSLQPAPVFCPCPKSTDAGNATSMLPTMSAHRRGERNGEPQREPCLSCTVHFSAPEKAFESHSDLRPSTTTEASETQNVRNKLRPPPERPPAPSFLILLCEPLLESSAPLIHRSSFQTLPPNQPKKRLHQAYGRQRELPSIYSEALKEGKPQRESF